MVSGLATLLSLVLGLALTGCVGEYGTMEPDGRPGPGGPARPTDPDGPGTAEPAWSLEIDTRETSPYLPVDARSGPIRGRVTASEGIGRLEIGGMRATTTPDGT